MPGSDAQIARQRPGHPVACCVHATFRAFPVASLPQQPTDIRHESRNGGTVEQLAHQLNSVMDKASRNDINNVQYRLSSKNRGVLIQERAAPPSGGAVFFLGGASVMECAPCVQGRFVNRTSIRTGLQENGVKKHGPIRDTTLPSPGRRPGSPRATLRGITR